MDETRLDKIEIKELEVFANHGVYPEENVLGQKFVISAIVDVHIVGYCNVRDLHISIGQRVGYSIHNSYIYAQYHSASEYDTAHGAGGRGRAHARHGHRPAHHR